MPDISPKVAEFLNTHWNPGMGAIDGHDLRFIHSILCETEPKAVVEIGCASGVSTSLLAMMLPDAKVHSFDKGERFYADKTKEVGYLAKALSPEGRAAIEISSGCTSLNVQDHYEPNSIDFCFIDAAHKHPWPAIDTLAVLPLMKPGSYIVHHDLNMFRGKGMQYATGPKAIFELTPGNLRSTFASRVDKSETVGLKTRHITNNIFAIRVPKHKARLAERISEAFLLNWDPMRAGKLVPDEHADEFQKFLDRTHNPIVGSNFRLGRARMDIFARPARQKNKVVAKQPSANGVIAKAMRIVGLRSST
ncbi:class I SAM-dependent methyltransferase [Ruegeria jejuensis]|uniref:class I SAM-dependent methyltransferase n=1 Tax=Ruegeria jejuensis TaxID=3233338 RepID=UPI00355C2A62